MSGAEVARMKATLRFLREHRSTLKLKVNAAEDLLLNGRREPTHRGLCLHLLSKLDRTRVLQAAAHMAPAQATEFLGGIVRFAPEVPYLIEFLRSVKSSAHPRQAAAALNQALERLDFSETSSAQMRDLLQLIVDVFPASELPVFVFTLLSGAAFRSAFDRSSEVLPSTLAELLVPLRSLHRSLSRRGGGGRREAAPPEARLSREQVREGARLLLGASRESLLELGDGVRRQLFEAGCDALGRTIVPAASAESLLGLFGSVQFRDAAARGEALRELAGALLRAGLETPARELLRAEQAALGDARWAQHWLALLGGLRVGRLALEGRAPRHARRRRGRPEADDAAEAAPAEAPALASDRWQRAFHVPTQQDVLVRFDDPAAAGAVRAHAALRARALVPGVSPVVEAALEPKGSAPAYLALAWLGPALPRRLHDSRASAELALGWCQEACRLLWAVAAAGIELPDASAQRFSVDPAERLWLVDLWSARAVTGAPPFAAHLDLGRQVCREILAVLDRDPLSRVASQAFDAAGNFSELLAALAAD